MRNKFVGESHILKEDRASDPELSSVTFKTRRWWELLAPRMAGAGWLLTYCHGAQIVNTDAEWVRRG